ncbi:hypothetical protein DFH06DRAFT_1483050 [Mycena polygramma]|nr:hypothetical protein DFH06DRAFT_1483050 [Mycena polygramma]
MPHLSSLHLTSSRDSYTPKPSHSTFSARLDKPKIPGYRVLAVAPCTHRPWPRLPFSPVNQAKKKGSKYVPRSVPVSPLIPSTATTRHARLRDRSSDDVLTCTSHYTDPSTPSIHTSTHDTRSPAAESRANPLSCTHLPVPPPTPESELCNGLQRPADLLKHKRDKRDLSPSIRTRPTAARRAEYAKDPHPAQDSSLHADSARPQDAASAPDLHARLACHTSRTPCRYIASCELRVSPTRSATAPCSPTGSSCRSRPALAARESSASPPIRDPYARRSLSAQHYPRSGEPSPPRSLCPAHSRVAPAAALFMRVRPL